AYIAALAFTSTVVRIWFPMDRWVKFVVPAELAHFPQYFSLFLFGIGAYRYHWLERIPVSAGKLWLTVGICAVALRFSYTLAHASFLRGSIWADLTWNSWEALLCVGLCTGLL